MPELFTIETEQVILVWSQRRAKQPPVAPGETEAPFGLVVQALFHRGVRFGMEGTVYCVIEVWGATDRRGKGIEVLRL